MSTPNPIRYPLDLTGRHPDNLVVGETHSIGTSGNRAIVLNYGPFYTRGLVVRRQSNGAVLTPRVHYKAAQLFADATYKTGQEICSIIVIDDPTVGNDFIIDYQVLGGDYSVSIDALRQLIETLNLDERPVRWAQILGKPEFFAPTPHLHDLGDLYGFEYLVAALEGVRQAILLGDVYKDQEIYGYIDRQDNLIRASLNAVNGVLTTHVQDTNNPHGTTKAHVGLDLVQNYPVASEQIARDGLSNVHYMTPLRTHAAINVHALRTDNPHGVTKAHVGLPLVQNFAVCTLEEALLGESQTTYTTPFHVQAMIDQAIDGLGPPDPPYVPPDVRFAVVGSVNVGPGQLHELEFVNQTIVGSSPISTWAWNFGDGGVSSLRNPPTQTYDAPGDYTVVLSATDGTGATRTYTVTLRLTQDVVAPVPPTVDYTYTGATTVTDPNNPVLNFAPVVSAGSSAIASYLWEFDVTGVASGAGADPITSTIADPSNHQYVLPISSVNLVVRLTVTDVNGLSGSRARNITLIKSASNIPPTANFSTSGGLTVTAPSNHVITFTDTSVAGSAAITGWLWDFGDSTTSTAPNPPAHTYTIPVGGSAIPVSLTTTDANGLTNTRTVTLNLTKNAAPLTPPTANFTTSGGLTVTEGSNHLIAVSDISTNGSGSITSWLWDWGDSTTSTGKTPAAHTYTVPVGSTARTITLTTTDSNGLIDTHTVTLTLVKTALTPPVAAFTRGGVLTVTEPDEHVITFTDASTAGTGAITSWLWNFGDGSTSTAQNPPPHTYSNPVGSNAYTVRLTVTDVYGRTATTTQTLTLVKAQFTLPPLTNLNFESGDVSWTKSTNCTIVNTGPAAVDGTWRARITFGGGGVRAVGGNPVVAGDFVSVACFVRPSNAADNVGGAIRLLWLDYYGNMLSNKAGNIVQVANSNNVWKISYVQQNAPEGAYYYSFQGEGFVEHAAATVEFDLFQIDYVPPSGPGGGGGPGDPDIPYEPL